MQFHLANDCLFLVDDGNLLREQTEWDDLAHILYHASDSAGK